MSLLSLGEIMRQRFDRMASNRAKDALVLANDLKALVQLRIQTTGVAYTGRKFNSYSPGYAKKRASIGAQTSIVDFTVTGQMWGNIRAEVVASDSVSTTVDITARDTRNQMKLQGALTQPKSAPRGNLLIPNEQEIATAQEANRQRVLKYLTTDA